MTQEPWWTDHPDLLPPDPDLEPLHARDYSVRAWKLADDALLIRGAVMDLKPGGPFEERIAAAGGSDDGRPVTMHHMVVDLTVAFPSMTITDVDVVFASFPQPGCPAISASYRDLIGVSIARGFTHEVRRLFGGPRGCSHTTALLQAMGPVAVQCAFSMRGGVVRPADAGATGPSSFMRDTCHVWASDGELWSGLTAGQPPPVPLPMQRRIRAAGLEPEDVDPRV